MSILQNSNAISAPAGGDFYDYQIANSLFFNGTSQALRKTWGANASDNNKKALSFWIKRTATSGTRAQLGSTLNAKICSANEFHQLEIGTGNPTAPDQFHYGFAGGGAMNLMLQKWRDPSAWMHIIWIWNSDESTAVDRLKVYINGVNYVVNNTAYWNNVHSNPYPGSGDDSIFGKNGNQMHIGSYVYNNAEWYGGQMADFIMIDGAASYTDFGEFKNGVWKPVDPSGLTFGNNGFHLNFANASAPGNDVSGNNNDFTNIGSIPTSATLGDSPTFNSDSNGGNFCTYNPLQEQGTAQKLMALSEGNLQAESTTSDKYHQIIGNMGVKTGKWYIEWYVLAAGYPSWSVGWHHGTSLGLYNGNGGLAAIGNMQYMGYFTGNNVYVTNFGNTDTGNPQVAHSSFTNQGAPTTGDVIMCAIDNDAGKCWWGINGVWGNIGSGIGNPATGANASATWTIANYTDYKFPFTLSWASPVAEIVMNCGQEGTFGGAITAGGNADDTGYGNFKYDVPAGFLAMCTGNLPVADEIDPAQTDANYPQKLFNAVPYTGTDGTHTVAMGFKPDFLILKMRAAIGGGYPGNIWDTTRGDDYYHYPTGTNLSVASDSTSVEFVSTGFKLDNNWDGINHSGGTYIAHGWRANGGTTSTNNEGSVASTVQVDPSGSFSIVKWTGTSNSWSNAITVGHGLSKAPSLLICKKYAGNADQWEVLHTHTGNGGGATPAHNSLALNSAAALYTNQSYKGFGGVMPDADKFTVDGNNLNGASDTVIAYCFADCEGYIKSGSYEGNGNADGTFVYTGFRPAYILCKSVDSTSDWFVFDDKRLGYNVDNNAYSLNSSAGEITTDMIDLLSNGFKMRIATDPNVAETYVYLAVSSNPFKYATAK